jgi:phage gp36-like protein
MIMIVFCTTIYTYLVYNLHLVAERIVLEAAVELLRRLNEAAVELIVEAQEEAHGVEGHLRVVREHVAVHVQHDGSVGHHRGHPRLHSTAHRPLIS